MNQAFLQEETLGKSVEGRPIQAYVSPSKGNRTLLVFGGFHGDEPKSVRLARLLIEELQHASKPKSSVRWVIVPVVNPDGYEIRRRRNARRVDLNRNFPTTNWQCTSKRSRMFGGEAPASEPETRVVIQTIERFKPSAIITIHSIGRHRHCNNYDGPGRKLAERMSRSNGYPVTSTIGYPTPGSFGTWVGIERGIATITLELPSHHSPRQCWQENRQALASAVDEVKISAS